MLPKTHIILGLIASSILYLIFNLSLFDVSLFFLASVVIDIDHYLFYILRTREFNPVKLYKRHKSLPINHKMMVHIFHTIEFTVLALLFSLLNPVFFMVLWGVLFHSAFDLIDLFWRGMKFGKEGREFSMIRYLLSDKKHYY